MASAASLNSAARRRAPFETTRRSACGMGALGLASLAGAALGLAPGLSEASEAGEAASAPASASAASAPSGEVASSVAVPEGADDVPEGAVDPALPAAVTDDRGAEAEVASLDAVVALMGSFAKTWQLAGGSLVGVTDDALADYGLEGADGLSSVGDFTSPNLEQILALSPSLVVMSASTAGKGGSSSQIDLAEPLEAAGVPVLAFKVTLFGDYLRMLKCCCGLTGRWDLYRSAGLDVRDRIDRVLASAARAREASGGEAPTCAIMTTYSGGTRVLGSSTQAGAVAADLGAANVADASPSLLKDYSLESLVALDPDFIFVQAMGNSSEAAQRALIDQTEANPAWASLTAVAQGRYVLLDPQLFQYKPLDRWDEAYRFMARALYGDAAAE